MYIMLNTSIYLFPSKLLQLSKSNFLTTKKVVKKKEPTNIMSQEPKKPLIKSINRTYSFHHYRLEKVILSIR